MSTNLASLMRAVERHVERMRSKTHDGLEVKSDGDQCFRAIRKRDVSLPSPDYVLIEFTELHKGIIVVRRIAGPATELFRATPIGMPHTFDIDGDAATEAMLISQALDQFDFA